jgi:putative RecB family exonuclease
VRHPRAEPGVDGPTLLTPTIASSFTRCPLAYRLDTEEPERTRPGELVAALVARVLARLVAAPVPDRTPARADALLTEERGRLDREPGRGGQLLSPEDDRRASAHAGRLIANYFSLEDPRRVRALDLDLHLELDLGAARLRGVIDRVELDDDGLVVTQIRTGRSPRLGHERWDGDSGYPALLFELARGRRPERVRCFYLREPALVVDEPTERTIRSARRRVEALARTIQQCWERDDFRPRPSPRCARCPHAQRCDAAPSWTRTSQRGRSR